MSKYILALDQGTSSSRAILFNKQGEIVHQVQKEFTPYYPNPGWVEHNPEEIWLSQYEAATELICVSGVSLSEINGLGIANQRETTLVWDKVTGHPIYNAIVWQDKRTSDICDHLKESSLASYIQDCTGLVIDSYFSATKLRWILDHVPGAQAKAENGELLFGTVDTWLIWKLSNKQLHVSDYTNASRTMLFNIETLCWDKRILAKLNIPASMLPKVVESSGIVGYTCTSLFNGNSLPIAGIAGDQQAALYGQTGFNLGVAKNTYGTGCFILNYTGSKKVKSKNGLLSTLTCNTKVNSPKYAIEGAVFIAGAAIKWLRDSLKLIDKASQSEQIAFESRGSEVYVVPAFSGLGAPYWDQHARGAIFGLSLDVDDKQLVKATLESIAYQSKDVLAAMQKETGVTIRTIQVDGGASANNYLMQFQADILNTAVVRPVNIETTALGVAFLAGLATGFWVNTDEISRVRKVDKVFEPIMDQSQADKLYAGWLKAVNRTLKWNE